MNIKSRKDLAIEASKQIGKILKTGFGTILKIKGKKDKSLVSNIDLKAERTIIQLVKQYYPMDGILSEESKEQTSKSGYKWIIDPLDGTHNYIHKIDIFGTSIALTFEEKVIFGNYLHPLSKRIVYCSKR